MFDGNKLIFHVIKKYADLAIITKCPNATNITVQICSNKIKEYSPLITYNIFEFISFVFHDTFSVCLLH